MILARITAKGQTTIPRAVREALGVGPGDRISYIIDQHRGVTLHGAPDPAVDVELTRRLQVSFPEWFDELDAEFDKG